MKKMYAIERDGSLAYVSKGRIYRAMTHPRAKGATLFNSLGDARVAVAMEQDPWELDKTRFISFHISEAE